MISAITTCMSLTKVTVSSLQSMWVLKQKYDQVDVSITGIVSKLRIIDFSLAALEIWAHDKEGRKEANAGLVHQLESSIQACVAVVSGINAKVISGAETPGMREKLKFLWGETSIRNYERDLHSQMVALQLLLATAQL